jgi:DNA-binding beta-propeller fold protein YncE
MRYYGFLISIALMALAVPPARCSGATFGTVVPVGGQASDEALDETRGLLYIANFTANRIDVMSTATNTIQTSINVAAQPGSLTISPDSQYLLVAHFNNTTPPVPSANMLTLIHLSDNTQQTFTTSDPPLGVAFFATVPQNGSANLSGPGMALVVTTTGFYTLNPTNGVLSVVSTLTNVAGTTPVTVPTFPGQIIETALSVSGDKTVIWGIGGAGTGTQIIYQYYSRTNSLVAFEWVTTPSLLPRVSVAYDGSYAMIGWVLLNQAFEIQARYPNVITSTNVTGHAIDSTNGIIYAQIPDPTQPIGPPYNSTGTTAGTAPSTGLPELLIMANDNLTVTGRIKMQENIVGRVILNSAGTNLYAISDSGVSVFPVGTLKQAHRLASDHEDILVATTFCNRSALSQSMTISDPGGNQTDFTITTTQPGVTISPASGMTPATVTVTVDPTQFQTQGTTAVTLNISSVSAVNVPPSVRLLVNNPDEYQRGSVVDVPGVLTDLMTDPARNRFYIVRQDLNQLEVFDGTSNQMIVALRTATTPTYMAMTTDGNYLLVANDNSQLISVFDLNALQAVSPIVLPFSHFGHSVATSNNAILVLANNNATATGVIDTVSVQSGTGSQLPTLGIFQNLLSVTAVLAGSPNGANILVADPDGTVMLYSAAANTFTVTRKDYSALSGAFAASSYNSFVIGSYVFNASLVPQGSLSATAGVTSGFAFTGQGGYQVAASTQSTAGVIQNLPVLMGSQVSPTAMVEAPLLPSTTLNFTRTVAPLPSTLIALTTSGFTVLSANYAVATAPPAIASVQNAANGSTSVAPAGLISVYGSQLSATSIATSQIPLPTAMGESCLVVNGTPAGVSDNYNFVVASAAPAVFLSGTAGPETGLATIFRADNGQLVTPTNPLHGGDTVIIYLTGMGPTSPLVAAGQQTPPTLLTSVTQAPTLTLGSSTLTIDYAGLAPGYISGLYQINATLPGIVTLGESVPLVISQAGGSTTLNVRVVN